MHLLLEKFSPQDFADYFRLVGDAQVMAMIAERAIPVDEATRDYQQLLLSDAAHPDAGYFRILNAESGEFIGLGKLEIAADREDTAELGYMILPAFWGKGIASQVARLLVAKAHALPSLRRLVAIIDPDNLPSRKVLINNGFVSREFKTFDGLPGEVLDLTW
ncbi:RimJ/RimL family protein N-acetyltransferase [Enterobacter sp. BIGb0383]|uniref:GNAT family N-acetyltransferase n=1 Tax=unclassified Enterobacter TaxID=2608935 RepID=UPI000F47C98E|nr:MULTISPECIES: GNAT family N-acetyltransferase [unclassified Enterobacter]ROP62442.1 RimJ/RimL family protein N-acetyltransferase [Enterobacter sp. BIGb0383]ROS12602.1 RimJ/RimL family protein N-acetyltransferase [Enterobacter sp. BIGb0359]